jgi:hypothetical protein
MFLFIWVGRSRDVPSTLHGLFWAHFDPLFYCGTPSHDLASYPSSSLHGQSYICIYPWISAQRGSPRGGALQYVSRHSILVRVLTMRAIAVVVSLLILMFAEGDTIAALPPPSYRQSSAQPRFEQNRQPAIQDQSQTRSHDRLGWENGNRTHRILNTSIQSLQIKSQRGVHTSWRVYQSHVTYATEV